MVKHDREYRSAVEFRAADEGEYIVEGYATTFNDPYLMYEFDGVKYFEQVDRRAFEGADMNDVIFQYDHAGRVFARQKNGTLFLNVDDHGLRVRADLSKTDASRQLWEEIRAGLICEMSFAFSVAEDSYDQDAHTRTIQRIKKVYDVSAVSIPANPSTEISARSFFDGVIEREQAERLEAEQRSRQAQRIKLLCQL